MAILDADKEGFLRNYRSLIQTIGRAARNAHGQVIMYADKRTDSMDLAITETERRRSIQMAYNQEHGIVPKTIKKDVNDILDYVQQDAGNRTAEEVNRELANLSRSEVNRVVASMEEEMRQASADMDFERAAALRDQVVKLRAQVEGSTEESALADLRKSARKGSDFGRRKRK